MIGEFAARLLAAGAATARQGVHGLRSWIWVIVDAPGIQPSPRQPGRQEEKHHVEAQVQATVGDAIPIFANRPRVGGLLLFERQTEQGGMTEPTFDCRELPGGSDGGALGDGGWSPADEELLRRYRDARDEAAFTAMVQRHRPMVLRACQRLAGNFHDAEDAAEAVFLVLAGRPEFIRRSLAGGLHGLAWAAVSELRRARRRTDRGDDAQPATETDHTSLRGQSKP
jgi:hypothetical protein